MRSHLLEGKVRHRRSSPFVYELEHDVFYLALDTSELDRIGRMKLLGRNRWRPFTFRDDDHWKPAAEDIDALLVSTCTGYLCPGLTSYVGERLGLRSGSGRLHHGSLGQRQ